MSKSKAVSFADRTITVHELDVAAVIEFLAGAEEEAARVERILSLVSKGKTLPEGESLPLPHPLDRLMDSPLPFELILKCVPELTEGDLTVGVTASQLQPVYKAAEECNPFFVKMANKLEAKAKEAGSRFS